MTQEFYIKLHNLLLPYWAQLLTKIPKPEVDRLAEIAKKEQFKRLQAEQYELAEQKHYKFIRDLLNDEPRIRRLITRPAIADCRHLKGGSQGPKSFNLDYAVRMHTFPDGRSTIDCMVCGQHWEKFSEGWSKAIEMVQQSTNTPTSSEIAIVGTGKQFYDQSAKAVVLDNLFYTE